MAGGLGWVILSRKLFDSDPDWNEPREFSRFEAWIDVIQMTAYADHRKVAGGAMIDLHRGEVLLSVRFLARRWNWSNGRVTRWLKTGTATERLRVQRQTQDGYIYLLPNYDTYQVPWNTDGYSNGTGDETKRVQQRYTDGYKDKEGNTGKEEKEETPLPPAAASPLPADAGDDHPKKSKGERKSSRTSPVVPIPSELETPEFLLAWTARLRERSEPGRKGPAPSESSLTAQLEDLRRLSLSHGLPAAIGCVERATAGRWQGVVFKEDRENAPLPTNGTTAPSAEAQAWLAAGGPGAIRRDGSILLEAPGTIGGRAERRAELLAKGMAPAAADVELDRREAQARAEGILPASAPELRRPPSPSVPLVLMPAQVAH